jgi:hypothetical protein
MGDPICDRLHALARACDTATPAREWQALRKAIVDRIEIAGT